ncbi:GEVED domain-containing protein [Bacteroides sp.]
MKKFTLILLCLFSMVSIYAQDYCTATGSRSTATRTFSKLTFTGGTVEGVPQTLESSGFNMATLYQDKTSQTIEVTQGDELSLDIDHSTIWMYFYLYIDFDQNKEFNTDNELLFTVEPHGHGTEGALPSSMPTIKIPDNAPIGTTRLRFKSEWNSNNPCGDATTMTPNNGIMIDYTINIHPKKTSSIITIGNVEHGSVALSTPDGALESGTEVAINTEITVEAMPENGYKLVDILVGDTPIVGNTFTVGSSDVTVTATFIPENAYILTIEPTENGTITAVTVEGETETPITSGSGVIAGQTVKVTFTPDEKYLLETATLNGQNLMGSITENTYTFNMGTEASILNATFKRDPHFLEYCTPTFSGSLAQMPDSYLETITTTGAAIDLNQAYDSYTFYNMLPEAVTVSAGSTFTLNLNAKNLSTDKTSVHQDLRYTCAYMYIDWNLDGEFTNDNTEYSVLGGTVGTAPSDVIAGYYDQMMVINKEINVPVDASGTYRARVVYRNAWQGGAANACGNINEGVVYDFDIDVKDVYYNITITQPAEGATFQVFDGVTEVRDGDQVKLGNTLTIRPTVTSEDYEVRSVLVNGEAIEGMEFVFREESTVSLDVIKGRIISYSTTGEGTLLITEGGNAVDNHAVLLRGSNVTVKAVPTAGYHTESVMIGEEDQTEACSTADGYTFTLNEDTHIEAVFTANTYAFTYSYNEEFGSVTVQKANGDAISTGDMLSHNEEITVNCAPKTKCIIKSVKINGEEKIDELLIDNKKYFTLIITEETDVQITFEAEKYILTLQNTTPEKGSLIVTRTSDNTQLTDQSEIFYNETLNVAWEPKEGCELSSLLVKDGNSEPEDYVAEGVLEEFWDARSFPQDVYGNLAITVTFTGDPVSIHNNPISQVAVYSKDGKIIIENAEIGSNVSIYDVTGNIVSEFIVQKSIETSHISASPSIYLVRITNGSQSIVKKVMKN